MTANMFYNNNKSYANTRFTACFFSMPIILIGDAALAVVSSIILLCVTVLIRLVAVISIIGSVILNLIQKVTSVRFTQGIHIFD